MFTFFEIKRQFFFIPIFHSYSQYQEDLIIDKLYFKLKKHSKIAYIDVGANHPKKFNNTYHFYQKGLFGINIDPNPLLIKQYSINRQRDINICTGISDSLQNLTFYHLDPEVSSTFSSKNAMTSIKNGSKLISKNKIKIVPLRNILEKYKIKELDILSIDAEGYDFKVLLGINWKVCRPKIICIEDYLTSKEFLDKLGYQVVSTTYTNTILCHPQFLS